MRYRALGVTLMTAAVAACGMFAGDPIITPPVPTMAIIPTEVTVAVGAGDTLLAYVSGVAASADRTVDWSVGDTAVVRVTALTPPDHVLVIGRQAGTTTVTASGHAEPTVRASATVTVR